MEPRLSERSAPGDLSGSPRTERRADRVQTAFDRQTPTSDGFSAPDSALVQQLAERLTAAENYLRALQCRISTPATTDPQPIQILERALAQLEEATGLFRYLRRALERSAIDSGPLDPGSICETYKRDRADRQ